MQKAKDINIFSIGQLGSEPIIINYLRELSFNDKFRLAYWGVFESLSIHNVENIKVQHSLFKKNFLKRRLSYSLDILRARYKGIIGADSINIIAYFPGCCVLRYIVPRTILLIPSMSVNPNFFVRWSFDFVLRLEAKFFKRCIVVSDSMARYLGHTDCRVVPLGARKFKFHEINSSEIHFLYVGTLYNRNIIETVIAFHRVLQSDKTVVYHIVGRNSKAAEIEIVQYIEKHGLGSNIIFHGEVNFPKLYDLFALCTVGVSYIPINEYFDRQPVTKTFEYLSAGMFVLGTATLEQKMVINKNNGLLVSDNIDDFYSAILSIIKIKNSIDRKAIYDAHQQYSYERIVLDILIPNLELDS